MSCRRWFSTSDRPKYYSNMWNALQKKKILPGARSNRFSCWVKSWNFRQRNFIWVKCLQVTGRSLDILFLCQIQIVWLLLPVLFQPMMYLKNQKLSGKKEMLEPHFYFDEWKYLDFAISKGFTMNKAMENDSSKAFVKHFSDQLF